MLQTTTHDFDHFEKVVGVLDVELRRTQIADVQVRLVVVEDAFVFTLLELSVNGISDILQVLYERTKNDTMTSTCNGNVQWERAMGSSLGDAQRCAHIMGHVTPPGIIGFLGIVRHDAGAYARRKMLERSAAQHDALARSFSEIKGFDYENKKSGAEDTALRP